MDAKMNASHPPHPGGGAGFAAHTVMRLLTGGALRVAALIRERFAAWRERVRASALARREPELDWERQGRERFLRGAVDVYDVERRQRIWDRDEAGAYRMSGWP
jgi:hypothetical protein